MGVVKSGLASLSMSSAQAGQVTVQRGGYELSVAETEDATLEIELVRWPAQHRFVSMVAEVDDLDTGAGGTFDLGLRDKDQDPADTTDLTLFEAATSSQAASFTIHETAALMELAAVNYDRFIVFNVDVASATGIAAGVHVTLTTRPEIGAQFEN